MEIQKTNSKNPLYSGINSKILKGNSKCSQFSNCKNYASDSLLDSSINNSNSQSSTVRFRKYKLRCVSVSNKKENALYDINLVDSPGYAQDNNKSWLDDITKYIKNHV